MTQFYVGVKIIEAWEQEKDGQPGYAVKYADGYISWSPREAFEAAYLPMGLDKSRVSEETVERFLDRGRLRAMELDDKTVLARADTLTGFTQYETSACVDPKNFDFQIGKDICIGRIKETLWKCLGFVVQWGNSGLRRENAAKSAKTGSESA